MVLGSRPFVKIAIDIEPRASYNGDSNRDEPLRRKELHGIR
jgi:hypothetical protein